MTNMSWIELSLAALIVMIVGIACYSDYTLIVGALLALLGIAGEALGLVRKKKK